MAQRPTESSLNGSNYTVHGLTVYSHSSTFTVKHNSNTAIAVNIENVYDKKGMYASPFSCYVDPQNAAEMTALYAAVLRNIEKFKTARTTEQAQKIVNEM